MACYRPYKARRAFNGGVTFTPSKAWADLPELLIPCGQCIGCRLARTQEWATRISHEASYHDASCFLTLTYDDQHLPDDMSVSVRELQLFMKRARKALGKLRFFACGEYGDKTFRPHYHMILFGADFASTRTPWRQSKSGFVTYRSPLLEKLWPLGMSEIGTVTAGSAAYVARYCMKKMGGDIAETHYTRLHPLTGEICKVRPEFATMSSNPGIGRKWIDEYKSDIFPSDFVVIDGQKRPVPRYYLKQLTEEHASPNKIWGEQDILKNNRIEASRGHLDNNTPERLAVRETVQESRLQRLNRELDDNQ